MNFDSMKKSVLATIVPLFFSTFAHAQWAVYDDEVKKQLVKINNIKNIDNLGAGKTYDHFESERTGNNGVRSCLLP